MWSKENHTENSKIENAKEKAEFVKTKQSVKTIFSRHIRGSNGKLLDDGYELVNPKRKVMM